MSIVKVEILIKAQIPINSKGSQRYDILAIQPAGTPWGTGDLQGKVCVAVELDLPCGKDFMVKKRCSACKYSGITWKDEIVKEGSVGYPRITCPVQKYLSPDAEFTLAIDIRGIPNIKTNLFKKHAFKLDYSASVLSLETKNIIESEKSVTSDTADERLLAVRKASNLVLETAIAKKV